MIQRQADKVAICIMTIIIVLAGCAASGDKKVELPESVSIESIELQFMDDSGTSSGAVSIDNEEKDAIIELIQTTCKYRSESVYDNPQETPYISVNIHAKTEEENRVLYVYKKGNGYYVEQPYIGIWTTDEELYNRINSHAEGRKAGFTTEDITDNNISEVSSIMENAGLSNADVFKKWVGESTAGRSEESGANGFTDADCRMTVMLLAGESIGYESVDDNYDGTYLMFDTDAIENNEAYRVLLDKEKLFTTMFGEVPYSKDGFADALPENWRKHGIVFNNDKCSIISIVFKSLEKEEAFVGHTGILIDTRDIEGAEANYLFIEKLAFGEPFKVTKLNDKEELIPLFSQRADYTVEKDEPAPMVYENDKILGELKRPKEAGD